MLAYELEPGQIAILSDGSSIFTVLVLKEGELVNLESLWVLGDPENYKVIKILPSYLFMDPTLMSEAHKKLISS